MRRNSLTLLVLLLVASPLARAQEHPVTEEELLMRPAGTAGSSPLSVDVAFQTAMARSGGPGGAAILQGCEGSSDKVVRVHGSTLREVLDDIVTADPNYVWHLRDGVVNLMPAKGVPALLTLRIAAYDSGDATDLRTAGTYLLALPVVRERADELGFTRAVFGTGLSALLPGAPPAPKLNVRLQDVTLLEALNALVRANRHGAWVYYETHCKSENNFQVQFPE